MAWNNLNQLHGKENNSVVSVFTLKKPFCKYAFEIDLDSSLYELLHQLSFSG